MIKAKCSVAEQSMTRLWRSLLLGYFISCGASVLGATYYVDFEGGNDGNAGTSPNTPWKYCPGDSRASGSAAIVLVAGDSVLFKRGSTYVLTNSLVGASGSPSAGIFYNGLGWGDSSNRCVITSRNFEVTAISLERKSNVVVSGFAFQDIGGYAEDDPIWDTTTAVTTPPGGVGVNANFAVSIQITNCTFREVGQWQNKIPMSGAGSVTGDGVNATDSSGVWIADCDFTRMKRGVVIQAVRSVSGVVITNCSFHNYMNWLIDIAPRASGAVLSNIVIDSCSFFDYKEFDTPNWTGYGEKPHQDGIFLRASGMVSTWTNIVVRNSTFWSDESTGGGTASIYISEGPSVDIYNCVFKNDVHANGNITVNHRKLMPQSVRIWNCSFAGEARAVKFAGNPDLFELRNSAFYRTTSYDVITIAPLPGVGQVVLNNNLYYGADPRRCVFDGAYRTLEQWRSLSGQDSASIWSNPRYANISGPPSTWRLVPGDRLSPAINKSMRAGHFTTDITGADRGEQWDIGAYEYDGKIAAPDNLRTR